jgi:hypothetical protein
MGDSSKKKYLAPAIMKTAPKRAAADQTNDSL